jgi:DNA replication protein DnaC
MPNQQIMKKPYNPATEKPFFIDEKGTRNFDFDKTIYYLQHIGRQKFGKHFRIYKEDLTIISKLLVYFTKSQNYYEKYSIDPNKGILLAGPIGCGKTSLITLMTEFTLQNNHFYMKSTRAIAAEFHEDGYQVIQKYSWRQQIYCFDDLGVEQNMKYYGNECNTIAEILLNRYDLMVKHGHVTHATTNLSASDLEALYGNRLRSRMREMFNLIAFPNNTPDKRK